MADKGPGSSGRTAKKRLARAKIKPTDNGIKSSKGRKVVVEEKSKTELKRERNKKLTGIAVGIFAVIMALSMMLPSLTYIFGNNAAEPQEEVTQAADAEEASPDDAATDEDVPTGIAAVDANYATVVDPLEAKLKDNPQDLATLLNLGNDYMSWASTAGAYATDDEGVAHVNDLFGKAIGYFDQYLQLNDSPAVKVNRALCVYYSGSTDQAIADLEALTTEESGYGPAWANLGMLYENEGSTDEARAAYQKAVEADPDDEYGAKSYANRRLASMSASSSSTDSSTGGAAALEDALGAGL